MRRLPFERFLNIIYYEMTQRLEYDDKNPRKFRTKLDMDLEVKTWKLPGNAYRQRQPASNAPAWWRGDEDASQTFMHAMGVVSLK